MLSHKKLWKLACKSIKSRKQLLVRSEELFSTCNSQQFITSVFKHQFQASKRPWISSDNDGVNFCPTVHWFWSGIFYFTFFLSLRCWNKIQMVPHNSTQLLWTPRLWCWTCHTVFSIGKDPFWMVWSNTHFCGRGLEYKWKYSKHISVV